MKKKIQVLFSEETGTYSRTYESILNVVNVISHYKYTGSDTVIWLELLEEI